MNHKKEMRIPVIALIILILGIAILLMLLYILPGRYRLYQTTLYDPLEEAPANPLMGFAPEAEEDDNTKNARLVTIDLHWKDWEPEKGQFDTGGLEETYHINDYKKRNMHGVLRFQTGGKEENRGWKADQAIEALGKYFAGDSFISFVEIGKKETGYIDAWREAFPQARLILPSDSYELAGEKKCGIYIEDLGDQKKQRRISSLVKSIDLRSGLPVGGSLCARVESNEILNSGLAGVLQEIRDGHLTYISGNCPAAGDQEGNGYRMISQTLGYCIYIKKLQTTVNFRKDTVTLKFIFTNTGVAPAAVDWPVVMTVYNHRNHRIYEKALPMKAGDVLPGQDLEVKGEFPYNRKLGRGYSVGIRICNPDDEEDYITLAQKETKAGRRGEHIIYRYDPQRRGKKVNIAHPDSYQHAMISLLADLSSYAKSRNPDFFMVTNGGYKLYMPRYNKSEENRSLLISSMDGMMIESVFYGYDEEDNKETPEKISEEMQEAVRDILEEDLPVFNIEYCSNNKIRKESAKKSRQLGTIWYNAIDTELSRIPKLSESRSHDEDCRAMSDVENFIAVLNPDYYKTKEAYLKALRSTNYDMLFIDLEFKGEPLTRKDIDSLRKKKDGGKRLVCAYMSVGEAENYRSYWQASWNDNPPPWICEVNENWEGNYKVMYWTKPWRDILFGKDNSYLDQILAAGFDGVYLDVVDAYEYFEEQEGG